MVLFKILWIIDALTSLTFVANQLQINGYLTDISPLHNLQSVGDFQIECYDSDPANALANIKYVGNHLGLYLYSATNINLSSIIDAGSINIVAPYVTSIEGCFTSLQEVLYDADFEFENISSWTPLCGFMMDEDDPNDENDDNELYIESSSQVCCSTLHAIFDHITATNVEYDSCDASPSCVTTLADICTCGTNACLNGGTCAEPVDLSSHYTCSCPPGFSGSRCHRADCTINPCNGNECVVNGDNTFSCVCNNDWLGDRCEIPVPCTTNSPCDFNTAWDRISSIPQVTDIDSVIPFYD